MEKLPNSDGFQFDNTMHLTETCVIEDPYDICNSVMSVCFQSFGSGGPCTQETACGGGTSGGSDAIPAWLSLSQLDLVNQQYTITVDPGEDFDLVGTETFYLKASYDDYPTIQFLSSGFDISI